ncbi:hypothetical protein SSP531S_09760 [Streptomyces spongiicola]|uniref:Lipoprotein n=1 Tax=Streptomyces spongiicola TaxID=1690221 RepID=A0A388SUQ0_9ACTN|nr:hypothetical protein [Streptomyces spongiicola]GBP99581.1 hypothetical protein SSP531S_09760 [Streptomyces spongiicola]
MRERRTRTALGALAAAAVLSACAAEAFEATDLAAVPTDKVADEIFRAGDIDLIEHVRNRLTGDCMDRQGYPQLKRTGLSRQSRPFADMDVRPPLFATRTDEQAKLLGFGEHRRPEAASVLSYDRGFDKQFERCRHAAGRRLGPEFSEIQNQSYRLYNDVADERDALLKSPAEAAVTAAALRPLLACVEAGGFRRHIPGARTLDSFGIGVPTGRHEGTGPAEPKRVPGTVEVLPAVPERRYVPTAEESRLAVASARCARQTGFGEKTAAQRARVIRKVVAAHESEIARLRPRVAELANSATKLAGP